MLAGWSILRADVYLFYLASKELRFVPRDDSVTGESATLSIPRSSTLLAAKSASCR